MSEKLQDKARWETNFLAFLYRQLIQDVPPLPELSSFVGKTAIVTGSNQGLGFECARQLLARGLSQLVIAVRSQSKGDAAAETLRREFPESKIDVSLLDMADYRSVVAFAKRCQDLQNLDIAILNAGMHIGEFKRAETGHELHFQVVYLSNILLTLLLVPLIKAKAQNDRGPGRIVMVGSDTAYWAKWEKPFDSSIFEVADSASYFTWNNYMECKMMLLMGLQRLSQAISAKDVIITVANPGLCAGTTLGTNLGSRSLSQQAAILKMLVGRRVEVGARQFVHAALAGPEVHGSFLSEGQIKPYVPSSRRSHLY